MMPSHFRAATIAQSRHAFHLGAIAAIALAAGCAVDQRKEIDTYRKVYVTDPTTQMSAANETLTLERALVIANQNNEQIARSGEDYLQALIDKNRAVAGFLPTVTLQPSFSIQDRGNVSTNSNTTAGGTSNNGSGSTGGSFVTRGNTLQRTQVPVNGQINIFNGFGDVANVKRTDLVALQRRALLIDQQATVLLNVAQVYYQVLRSERQVQVLQESVKVQQANVNDIESRQKAGLARSLDVFQSQAELANTRIQLTAAVRDVNNGRTNLAYLIGVPSVEGKLDEQFDIPPAAELPPMEDFEALGELQRQDLRAADFFVSAARQNVNVQVAQYYPSVTIDANTYLYRENFSNASKWDAILSINLPIFSAGLIEADVRTAWSQLRQAALDQSLLQRLVSQDIRQAYENLQTSDKSLVDLQAQLASAQEAFKQANQSYKVGLATNLEQLTAQITLLNAQLSLASEEFNRKVVYLQLKRVSGQLSTRVAGEAPVSPSKDPAVTQPSSPATPVVMR